MGDRISISFRKDGEESVAFFSHWDGLGFVKGAEEFAVYLKSFIASGSVPGSMPLGRLEPNTVMVNFVAAVAKGAEETGGWVMSNYYLGKDPNDGDNSDNGHHVIDL
jgi:hypothetical protein